MTIVYFVMVISACPVRVKYELWIFILTCDIDIAILFVRPSDCPSVRYVPVLDENGLTYCHGFFIIR